jgi:hypothetical protein
MLEYLIGNWGQLHIRSSRMSHQKAVSGKSDIKPTVTVASVKDSCSYYFFITRTIQLSGTSQSFY